MHTETRTILLPSIEPSRAHREIGGFVVARVLDLRLTGCVVGLSGGVDSTTTAAVIKTSFDEANAARGTHLELVGYVLPSSTNNPQDTEDGISVAQRLGVRYEVLGIESLIEAYRATNPEALLNHYDRGNLASRIRATVLNTKAATERKLVAGTGNRDEDFGIGYYTLFGDGAVHISPIAGLSKRLVREMAAYLGFGDLAGREPTAGLEPQQTDFKDLGYRYDIVEIVSEGLAQGFTRHELYRNEQVIRTAGQAIEEYSRIYGAPKFTAIEAMVDDICDRNAMAKSKTEILHPPAPQITLHYGESSAAI